VVPLCAMRASQAFGVSFETLDSDTSALLDDQILERHGSQFSHTISDTAKDKGKALLRIPSFSHEDRKKRETRRTSLFVILTRSDLVVGAAFTYGYLLPHAAGLQINDLVTIGIFICWHLCVTISKSIPDETSSIERLNMRTNASTFVAMVLYPALGVWSCQKFSHAENIFILMKNGQFQWGTIFPVLMWGMSALILVRESHHAVSVDHGSVVSNGEGGASLGLFRREPSYLEKFTHILGRVLTSSLWHWLRSHRRPAGGAGRFVFQLFSPIVMLFVYIGVRFILYATQQIMHLRMCYPVVCTTDFEGQDLRLAKGIFIIWIMFTMYCVVIRGFVTSYLFLRLTVRDPQTRKWLAPRWPLLTVESKRQRVLWAFRGLANAFVPYYYGVAKSLPNELDGALDYILWYIYFAVYVSFLMEGVGAVFFALVEAERGCQLKTPFLFFMKQAFWCAYNTFLQPLGTVVNLLFAVLNGEFRTKLKLRELFEPLLNDRGEFHGWLWRKRVQASHLTQEELEDWISTWKRNRESAGKSTDTLDIVKPVQPVTEAAGVPAVFQGTVFPTWYERNEMMEHHRRHISLKPWEAHESEEKFQRWHPTYREEVMDLLSEPYNFSKLREVWVFGYGSLMSPDSPPEGLSERQRKLFLPYRIKKEAGYQRCWNYRHGGVGINALGLRKVTQDKADHICGIAYPMDYEFASELFSKREDGYRLLLLHEDLLEPMHPDYRIPKGCGYVWIVGEPISKCKGPENLTCENYKCKRHWPTHDSPILQSYVDEIIAGCLKYKTLSGKNDGMNFAAAVIRSIHGWENPWFNDRLLSGRPWKFAADYEVTDGLLNTCPASHEGFIQRFRPVLGPSPVLGRLYQSAFENSLPWGKHFFGNASNSAAEEFADNSQFPDHDPYCRACLKTEVKDCQALAAELPDSSRAADRLAAAQDALESARSSAVVEAERVADEAQTAAKAAVEAADAAMAKLCAAEADELQAGAIRAARLNMPRLLCGKRERRGRLPNNHLPTLLDKE
jgi:hypothetical protein